MRLVSEKVSERPRHIHVEESTVAELVADQFPQWDSPVTRVTSHGTTNTLFRIGDDLVARFPIHGTNPDNKRAQLNNEAEAARKLRSIASVATPEFLALGEPADDFPLPWAVCGWIPGIVAGEAGVANSPSFAEQLADFISEVRTLNTEGKVFEGTGRGGVLTQHDSYVANGLTAGRDMIDTSSLAALWDRLRATPRTDPDAWTHGDLMPGNLLADEAGRLVGVIDVGQAGVADPALDLQPAWNMFDQDARAAFRSALKVDDAAWDRGKGWAFAQAIGCLAYYRDTNRVMSETARATLLALLADE